MRKVAWQILRAWHKEDVPVTDILQRTWAKSSLAQRDKALIQELVYGVLRYRPYLDRCVQACAHGPLTKIEEDILDILRLGVYQIMFLQRMPVYAAVSETVDVAPLRARSFVNAVLRQVLRKKGELILKEPQAKDIFPPWLVQWLEGACTTEEQSAMVRFAQEIPPVYAWWNAKQGSVQNLEEAWSKDGVAFQPVATHPGAYVLSVDADMRNWSSFQRGLFWVQDLTAAHMVSLLDIHPAHQVLDACAAPGGKAAQIVQLLHSSKQLTAVDVSAKRLEQVYENMKRLRCEGVQVVCDDARKWGQGRLFDRIILDVPCSNLGVLSRRVDVRWRMTPDVAASLVVLQRELLMHVSGLLKPDGVLLYSTCTLTAEENSGNIQWFLSQNPAFRLVREWRHVPGMGLGDGGYGAVLKISKN